MEQFLMSRQFIQGQQARHRFAENFRLGETVEDFRSLIPQKYGSVEAETNDRLFGIRKERLQQRIGIRLGQHFAEISPCRVVNGDGRRRKRATVRGGKKPAGERKKPIGQRQT